MPPKGQKRVAPSETYSNDDGFVEDAPKSKKAKQSAGNAVKEKDGKAPISTEMQKDDEGNEYWEVSKTRRITVSTFKGNTMVGIREFYEKDGKSLPGKKGISLPIDQFAAMLDVLPDIESVLKGKGVEIPRRKHGGTENASKAVAADGEEDDDEVKAEVKGEAEDVKAEDGGEEDEKPAASKLDKFRVKPNHEATSDEDEG